MKTLKRIFGLIILILLSATAHTQITGPGASTTTSTAYTNGTTNDIIYIFCSNPSNPTMGSLSATPTGGTGPYTFNWYSYDSGPNSWVPYSTTAGATSTINGLPSGGYFVTITDSNGNPSGCARAWVFVNETIVDAGAPINACGSFNLSGTANAVSNFVYFNPPPNPLTINNTTQIQVCFNATHTWVSDLAFYLVGPASCGSPTILLSPNPGAIGQGTVCNSGNNVANLCFSSTSTNILNVCNPSPSTLSGTYGRYGPGAGTAINWAGLYGCDASAGGWSVQIYDCIGGDVGALTNASISFNGNTSCGPLNVNYTSGAINSVINDNSCTAASASIFTVPQNPNILTPITLNNSITSVSWSTGASTLNTTVNPAPLTNTMYYLTATDNFGCTHTDSVLFTNTCVCNINNITANISAPDCALGTFSVSGQVAFTNAPATGTLTVTNCSGNSVTFNAPFTSPINYNIPNITADGTTNCNVTATFSATPACTATVGPFTEPICNCFFSLIDITIGTCNSVNNTFNITGTVEFQTPPATGTLIIQDCNGNSTTFNAPFTSPQAFTISNIPANAQANCSVTASFSANPICNIVSPTYTNPSGCLCPVDAGTFSSNLTGSSTNNVNLCFGDQFNIVGNGDFIPPDPIADPTVTYDPGLWLMVYSCPPSVFSPNDFITNDPCFIGIQSAANGNWTLTNNLGNGTTLYYVPLTMYSMTDGIYSNVFLPSPDCFDFGPTFPITYLPQITSNIVPNCANGTSVVTLNGGLPQVDGSSFTASNLLPATASFSNTSATNGGTITITGLQHGDLYSFTITDGTGCTHNVTGGPFVGTPIAIAGTDAAFCALTGTLGATPLTFGTGTWTGPAGITFTNSTSATSGVNATAAGSYTLTWTATTGAGCTTTDQVVIQFSNVQYNQTPTDPTCGNPDGQIVLLGNSGIAPYTYSIDGGTTSQASGTFSGLLANTYNIIVTDALNCTETGTITLSNVGGPVINAINPVNINCNGQCTGSISINATGGTQFSIDNGTTFQPLNTFTALCDGTYDIVVEDAIGCTTSGTTTITEPTALTSSTTQVNLSCANVCIGSITVTANGGTAPYQYSIDNGTTNQISNIFSGLCAGNYTILVTDALGCTSTNNVTIIEPTPITLTLGITNATCAGLCNGMINSIPAGGTGTYTYTWTPAVGGNVPLVTNICAGTYSLTVADANGCSITDNNIVVAAPLAVTITSIPTVDELCGNDCTGSLTINATGATQYSINNGATFQASGTFSNLCQGTYDIVVQDASGCQATNVATISGPTPVSISSTGTTTICIGGTAPLTATANGGVGGFTYTWDNGGATQNINVSPIASQNFCVFATDANGCVTPQECELVTLNPALSVVALSNQAICIGQSAQISALASGGNGGPYTYTWNQGVGVGQNQTVTPNFTTLYTVTVTDNCGTPAATASVTITVNTTPNISFSGDNLSGCAPINTTFTDVNVPAGSTCLWSFGDGGTSTDCNIVNYTFNQPGCWDITLSIVTPEGCPTSVTLPDYVCAYDYPTPNFTFEPQPTTILNTAINFTNTTTNGATYIWSFDTLGVNGTSTSVNPTFVFPSESGSYTVCLEAFTTEGCPAEICQNVIILDEFILYVPNAFTPDGDAKNPTFFPIISGIEPMSYEFLIFNRWGQLIYESNFAGQGWDGTYNGILSQQDVYVWKLNVVDVSGKTHSYIGHVTLVR